VALGRHRWIRILKEHSKTEVARVIPFEAGSRLEKLLRRRALHSSITTTQRYMNARASSLAKSMRQTRERRVNQVNTLEATA
jgi:hypothetical protein